MTPIAVKEWPAPIGLMRVPVSAAWVTACWICATEPGVCSCTWAVAVAAQFVHVVMATSLNWTSVQVKA